jgi:hypothetical protein
MTMNLSGRSEIGDIIRNTSDIATVYPNASLK